MIRFILNIISSAIGFVIACIIINMIDMPESQKKPHFLDIYEPKYHESILSYHQKLVEIRDIYQFALGMSKMEDCRPYWDNIFDRLDVLVDLFPDYVNDIDSLPPRDVFVEGLKVDFHRLSPKQKLQVLDYLEIVQNNKKIKE